MAGKAEQMKGAAKEKVGEWTDNPDLEAEGVGDQAAGKARETVGTAKRKAEEAADALHDKVKDKLR
ncbi:MAG: CsbD family protein [Acidobacteria bacterium]|nr:CsbD family protein [Acidobacteriota bacterium]